MKFNEWRPFYFDILADMGYDMSEDEKSANILKNLMLDSNLTSENELFIKNEVSVFGGSNSLSRDIDYFKPRGTLISAGSATETVMAKGIIPNILVTDLDGNMESQIKASSKGAITLIHAHGGNVNLITKYAKKFKGKVILTTQSVPDFILHNFGGFTDGDRSVCLARHLGAKKIYLYGFDYEHPSSKPDSDPLIKLKKLSWAKRIIELRTNDIIKI
ncbi:MAG: DUF115 domain-containing protein [archaeon]|nr:DUF115 domain-containing protein [archaeon]